MGKGIYDSDDTFRKEKLIIQIDKLGDWNPNKLIYFIEAGTEISGLCALIRRTLSGIYIADMLHAIPVVSWKKSRLLNEHREINGSDNPFEYFFEPVSTISIQEALESVQVITHKYDEYLWSDGKLSSSDGQTEAYINLQQELVKKYQIRLKQAVMDEIQEEVDGLFGSCKALGVHIRGAQRRRRIIGLANPIPLDWYFEKIDRFFTANTYDKLFIATDDEEYLKAVQDRYQEKVLYFKDVARCKNGIIPYFSSEMPKYQVTYETLRDIYALIRSDSFMGGPSNVTSVARVLKGNSKWEHCIMLENGVCEDGEANYENTMKIIEHNGNLNILN